MSGCRIVDVVVDGLGYIFLESDLSVEIPARVRWVRRQMD
jgi:hypothetical protein